MLNTGDTAWLLISAALVLLMTPGVAFFYSGLVSTRSAVNTISMCFICCAVVPLVWTLIGYSLVFSTNNQWIGGLEWAGLHGLANTVKGTTPAYAFMAFQMMFAVISPALIAGSVVGRMRFKTYVVFVALWSLFIYNPIAHWVWGPDGWIALYGALDFAGGTVVHINAGFAALVAAIVLGPRLASLTAAPEFSDSNAPHNVPFVILGTSLLWFGWYGFNAGSALAANELASLSFVTTTLATCASILTWISLNWMRKIPPSSVGIAVAAVVGLVTITPAAGYVTPMSSIVIGIVGALVCYLFMTHRPTIFKRIDDTLDVFTCHGLAGVAGALLTGIFASKEVNPAGNNGWFYGNPQLFWKQIIAVVAVIATTVIGTAIILYLLKKFMKIRPSAAEERLGIDLAEHAESAYSRRIKRNKEGQK